MPVDQHDLQARVAAATAQDTVRGLIFNALFDALEEHGGRPMALLCDAERKGQRTDFFSYPVADLLATVGRAVDQLEAKVGSVDRAYYEIGYRTAANVLASAMGATIVTMARRSPRSLLGQLPTAYKGMVSYGERRLEWLGERKARLTFSREFLAPPFHRGVLTGAVEALGGKNVQVTTTQAGLLEGTYDVTWDA